VTVVICCADLIGRSGAALTFENAVNSLWVYTSNYIVELKK
jgi:hypothetical protein